jgi:hypothetical protein
MRHSATGLFSSDAATQQQCDGQRKLRCVGLDDEDMSRMIHRILFSYHVNADLDASCSLGRSVEEQEAFIDVAMGVRHPDLSYTQGEPVQADVVLVDENINETANPPILGSLLSAELRMCGFTGIIVIFAGASASEIKQLRSRPGVDLAYGKADGLPSIAADITSLYLQRCAGATAADVRPQSGLRLDDRPLHPVQPLRARMLALA